MGDDGNLGYGFERIAERFADRVALHGATGPISYADLAARVRAGAALLDALGGSDSDPRVVAVLATHGAASLTGFLSALRAGCIATVLAPEGSESLLRRRLELSRADTLLYDAETQALAERVAGERIRRASVEEISRGQSGSTPSGALSIQRDADRPALLIFTSGSTGDPAGVLHSHASIRQNIDFHGNALGLDERDVATWSASLGTISGVTDSLRILMRGGSLYPLDLHAVALAQLPEWVRASGATVTHLVPTVFRRMTQHAAPDAFHAIRILHLGGEPVTRRDFELFRRHFPAGCRLLNNLGCSEVPSFRQSLLRPEDDWEGDVVPLRSAVPGKTVVLLDADGGEIGTDGTPGEIAVDTCHAALGYWHDPSRTSRAFETKPDGSVRFRTGDLGQWQSDGGLVHLGRSDRSLKVAGRWVDLASVEAAFQRDPAVREVVAIASTSAGAVRLTAFCASDEDATALRNRAAQHLEPWQMPARIILCDELPTLANGKLDRRELKRRAEGDRAASPARRSARQATFTERRLIALWESVLGDADEAHPESSFIEQGGDSLAATELAYRIEVEFGIEMPRALVFETLNLGELAEAIDALGRSGSTSEYLYWGAPQTGERPVLCVGDHRPLLSMLERFGRDAGVAHLRLDGLQTRRFRRLSIDAQVDAYLSELRAAEIGEVGGIVGFSYGGLVALALAAALARIGDRTPPLLLLEPSVPGHPAPEAGGNSPRVRLRVWLDSWRGRWRAVPDWEACRWDLWKNVERFSPAPLQGHTTLVATTAYLEQWGATWRAILPDGEFLPIAAPDHLSLVAPQYAGAWLDRVAGWIR